MIINVCVIELEDLMAWFQFWYTRVIEFRIECLLMLIHRTYDFDEVQRNAVFRCHEATFAQIDKCVLIAHVGFRLNSFRFSIFKGSKRESASEKES